MSARVAQDHHQHLTDEVLRTSSSNLLMTTVNSACSLPHPPAFRAGKRPSGGETLECLLPAGGLWAAASQNCKAPLHSDGRPLQENGWTCHV